MTIKARFAFLVQANIDDHTLAATAETAEEAFAKAVEWQVVQLADVTIFDGTRRYSVAEFASLIALKEGIDTVDASAQLMRTEKPEGQ
jgi:hypothetical protein